MLVSTKHRPQTDPGNTLDDYAAWRSLAIAIRRSAIAERGPATDIWLKKWADWGTPLESGSLLFKSNPSKDDISGLSGRDWPKLPGDPLALALGGSRGFTDKIPSLVQYAIDGDALTDASDGEHRAARERNVKLPDGRTDTDAALLPWLKPAIFGGLFAVAAGGIAWIVMKLRGSIE
jgi:hypothetical protein